MLIIFGGLPGVGKTEIARELSRQIGAVYVRIDSIEQALQDPGAVAASLDDAGYRVAYALAEDNLRLGRTVVADSVNPVTVTRDAWLNIATKTGALAIEIEIKCSDLVEHRRRVESRSTDVPGLRLPTWEQVISREYDPWSREHISIDTAHCTLEQAVSLIRGAMQEK